MMKKSPHLTIKDWSPQDKPREKMIAKGADALSNAELLAIIIGSGNVNETAVQLTQRLLNSIENRLEKLYQMPYETLLDWKGVGPAKAVKIKAAVEIAKRMQFQPKTSTPKCSTSYAAYSCIQEDFLALGHEEFWVMYLNQQCRLLKKSCLIKGGIAQSTVDIRLLLKRALELGATAIIVAHNHPSGELTPSTADKQITEKIKTAARHLDIRLLDHLILSEKGYFSFADQNIL